MKWFNKIEKYLINIWGVLWVLGITGMSVGVVIWAFKWIANLLGVL